MLCVWIHLEETDEIQMASMLVALAFLLKAILNFKRMYIYLCMHDSTWCWWHSNKVKPPILEFGPYPELTKINDSLSTEFNSSCTSDCKPRLWQQGLQSRCFVPCLTYCTAWCLCYITEDTQTNHTTYTVHSTNIRITENPRGEGGNKNQVPSLLNQCVLSFHLERERVHINK